MDSGSTHSFIDSALQHRLTNMQNISPVSVAVAGGGTLQCTSMFQGCSWSCDSVQFSSDFRMLPLASYDGIIGLDWLAKHSPMQVDWVQKWMSFYHQGKLVTVQGLLPEDVAGTVFFVSLIRPVEDKVKHKELQVLMDKHAVVFETPTSLPPRRLKEHTIPLIPGARPVSVRP